MHRIFVNCIHSLDVIRWFTVTDSQCEKFNTCYLRAREKNKRVHQFQRIKEPSIDILNTGNNYTISLYREYLQPKLHPKCKIAFTSTEMKFGEMWESDFS